MTPAELVDTMRALTETQNYIPSQQPFNFDLQPDQRLQHCYCLQAAKTSTEGWVGGAKAENWQITIWLAQRTQGNSHGAYRQLLADLPVLQAAIIAPEEAGTADYNISDDPQPVIDLPPPGGKQDFVIGRLVFTAVITPS